MTIPLDESCEPPPHTHRQLLQRNPENWQLIRMYAKFLEFIRNDPWGAAKHNA